MDSHVLPCEVAIVRGGNVGSPTAHALMMDGVASEFVWWNKTKKAGVPFSVSIDLNKQELKLFHESAQKVTSDIKKALKIL